MLKSCIKLMGLAAIFIAASSSVGLANVSHEMLQHPANVRLAAILSRNNLTNQNAPVVQYVAPSAAPVIYPSLMGSECGAAPVIAKVTPVQKVSAVPSQYEAIYKLVEKEAHRIGISPLTMMAIEIHESGAYRSPLWRNANNPGGIEFRHFETVNCRRHNGGRWAEFETPADGIKAHAEVLSKPRYHGATGTNDPYEQVSFIARGGYCEPGYNWTPQVKRHLSKLMGGAMYFADEIRSKLGRRHKRKKRVGMMVD